MIESHLEWTRRNIHRKFQNHRRNRYYAIYTVYLCEVKDIMKIASVE